MHVSIYQIRAHVDNIGSSSIHACAPSNSVCMDHILGCAMSLVNRWEHQSAVMLNAISAHHSDDPDDG